MDYDLIAIGDIVTDAFVKLKEAEVVCDANNEHCKIAMPFGDKIPYENVWVVPAVGNSPNAAVSASRLGLHSAILTNIGSDLEGGQCLTALSKNGVDTKFVKTHEGMKTNYHYVLWYGDDRTILIKHEDYQYELPEIGNPKWIYLSSLGQSSENYQGILAEYLASHPEVKLAFQPGTFQIRMGKEKLAGIYARTEIFFCNKEEAQRILGVNEEDEKILMTMIATLGPKIVVVTDGPRGAYAYNGLVSYFMPAYPDPKAPLERTGAGDAFSSTVSTALALGLPLAEALRWGPVNSMSVVQAVGAQEGLLSREALEELLSKAPEWYEPKEI